MNRIISFCFSVMLIISSKTDFCHGDLHGQILEVSSQIQVFPDSAYLYFKRGKLHFYHEEYDKCLNDLELAQLKGFDDDLQKLFFAKAYLKLDNIRVSKKYIQQVLQKNRNHVVALKIQAQIYYANKEFKKAALSYEKVVDHSIKTFPENYIDAATSWELVNTKKGNLEAIQIVEKGVEELGPIISLLIHMRDFCIRKEFFEKAISTQNRILEQSKRKESGYYKLFQIYSLAGDSDSAQKQLRLAWNALNLLPQRIRNTKSMQELSENIQKEIGNL